MATAADEDGARDGGFMKDVVGVFGEKMVTHWVSGSFQKAARRWSKNRSALGGCILLY